MGVFHGRITVKTILKSAAAAAVLLSFASIAPAQAAGIGACLITKTDTNPFFVKMKEGASKKSAFGNTVKFATDQGVVYIDGNQNPPAVTNDDKAADCTIKMDFADFTDMIGGKLDGMTAFMTGKLKIEGDMGVAMKLSQLV